MDRWVKAIGFPRTRRKFSTDRDLHSSIMWARLAADEVINRIINDNIHVGYIQVPVTQQPYIIDRLFQSNIDSKHFTIRVVHFPPLE